MLEQMHDPLSEDEHDDGRDDADDICSAKDDEQNLNSSLLRHVLLSRTCLKNNHQVLLSRTCIKNNYHVQPSSTPILDMPKEQTSSTTTKYYYPGPT